MFHRKIKNLLEETKNFTERKIENFRIEKQLKAIKEKRIAQDKKYESYFSRKRIDIKVNSIDIRGLPSEFFLDRDNFAPYQNLVQPKDLTGSTKLVCTVHRDVDNSTYKGFPINLSEHEFARIGQTVTLFQWIIGYYVTCLKFGSVYSGGLDLFKSLERSVKNFETLGGQTKKREVTELTETKVTMMLDCRKIQHFFQNSQGNIVISELQNRKFEVDDSLANKRNLFFVALDNRLFIEFLPEKRDRLVRHLQKAIKKLFNIEDLDKETDNLIDCIHLSLVGRSGIQPSEGPFIPRDIQEQILYNLAPDIPESYLRENFSPFGYRRQNQLLKTDI